MAQAAAKKYSLFQRSVRVTQTSIRRANAYLMERMPGLPNPPEMQQQLQTPMFKDLWENTLADHKQHLRDAWREYKDSFTDPADIDIEKSKEDIRRAAQRLRGQVQENASSNAAFLEEKLEGTQVLANIKEIGSTASSNAAFLKDELAKAQAQVDPDAVVQNVRAVVDEHRSKKDVVATLTGNVDELVDLVKTGRDAALKLEAKDVDALKGDAQSWFADKLMVAQSVLVAFIDGYREGKAMEVEREDALLLSYAKQAAQEQSVLLKQQFEQFVAVQKEKQEQERREQQQQQQRSGASPRIDGDAMTTTAEATMADGAPAVSASTQNVHPQSTQRSADDSRQ